MVKPKSVRNLCINQLECSEDEDIVDTPMEDKIVDWEEINSGDDEYEEPDYESLLREVRRLDRLLIINEKMISKLLKQSEEDKILIENQKKIIQTFKK